MKTDSVIEKIFTVNLGAKKNEKVLIFTDTIGEDEVLDQDESNRREGARRVAKKVAEVGMNLARTTYLEFPAVGSHGAEPPIEAWKAAFGGLVAYRLIEIDILDTIIAKKASDKMLKAAEEMMRECLDDGMPRSIDCVIALSNYSTTHTKFRDFLTRVMGVRYASCPRFDESMLDGVMTADWKAVEERTLGLTETLNGSIEAHVTTPLGTDIRLSLKGRRFKPDTGIITAPGSYSNLPAGESYVAPLEDTAEGRLVLEWAPTRKLKTPITIDVKEGRAISATGDDEYAEELQKTLKENPLCGNIAELGIGTNDKAKRPDNILESEKILGTIHIALGDNSTFGGKVSVAYHQDFIFFKPTLVVKKDNTEKVIIKDGEIVG